ncbi:hypothetical protein [Guptibacillus algicola]|uniref:hypothetical protein n=1 Tax=Guptibacillus algicola TaxID=225844 RepID=UPI001CD6F888|nr:hypothetical protein [Alkalihalobacillus algicola]MCA0988419.1 hypothetical protein [Alkalihalobacillus algicola]
MGRIRWMVKHFMREPLWFKVLIIVTLLTAIILSNSTFGASLQSLAKLAAAIFFISYGVKLRHSRLVSTIMFLVAGVSLYLAWSLLP